MVAPIVGGPDIPDSSASAYSQRWFLVDAHGRWLETVSLDGLQLTMRHGQLVIRAPGMLRLDIPLDVIEDDESVQSCVTIHAQTVQVVDEGDLVAVWFSNLLGQPCRLVKVMPGQESPSFTL